LLSAGQNRVREKQKMLVLLEFSNDFPLSLDRPKGRKWAAGDKTGLKNIFKIISK
jgi:hypothetical protein